MIDAWQDIPVHYGLRDCETLLQRHGPAAARLTALQPDLPGERVELIPSHCDTTVNLYDRYVCVRNGVVEAVWPIAARGRIQ